MEEKIIEYELVANSDYEYLTGYVNNLLNQNKGWKPLGGVAVAPRSAKDDTTVFAQAMVRIKQNG